MSKAKILLVDDEERIVSSVKAYLEQEGFDTVQAYDGEAALEAWRREAPDLVVLDIMMPGMDGLEFCRRVRRESSTPIIVLSARSSEEDKLAGLGLGADDYVTKPFSPRELVARIRALMRRFETEPDGAREIVREGSMLIDRQRRRVSLGGSEVPLTATEFDILAFLARHPGRVYSRDQLLYEVQGEAMRGCDSAAYSHIKNIRKKLGEAAPEWSFIETVHGAGYRFDAKKKT